MTRPVLFTPLSVTYSTCLPTRLSVSSPGFLSAGNRCLFSEERNEGGMTELVSVFESFARGFYPVTCSGVIYRSLKSNVEVRQSITYAYIYKALGIELRSFWNP